MSQGPGGIDSMKPSVDCFVEFFFSKTKYRKNAFYVKKVNFLTSHRHHHKDSEKP